MGKPDSLWKYHTQATQYAQQYGLQEMEPLAWRELAAQILNPDIAQIALELLKETSFVFRQKEDKKDWALNEKERGRVLLNLLNNSAQAITPLKNAFNYFTSNSQKSKSVETGLLLGMAYKNLGLYKRSFNYLQTALKESSGPRSKLTGTCFLDLASLQLLFGQMSESLKSVNSAIAIFDTLGQTHLLAQSYGVRGMFNNIFNQFEMAIQDEMVALELANQTKDEQLQANIYRNIGHIEFQHQNFEYAINNYKKAAHIDSGAFFKTNYMSDMACLTQAYIASEDYQSAKTQLSGLGLDVNNPKSAIQLQLSIPAIKITLYEGRLEDAELAAVKALNIAEKVLDQKSKWKILEILAEIYLQKKNMEMAIKSLEKAVDVLQDDFTLINIETEKAQIIKTYNKLIKFLIEKGRHKEALFYAEKAKQFLLLKRLNQQPLQYAHKDLGLETVADSLKELVLVDKAKLLELMGARLIDSTTINKQQTILLGHKQNYTTAKERAIMQNPIHHKWLSFNNVSIDSLLQLIPTDTRVISYYLLDEELETWLISRESISFYSQKIDTTKLDTETAAFVEWLSTEGEMGQSSFLSDILLSPIYEQLTNVKNLVIVPHEIIVNVPFAALQTGEDQYLGLDFSISASTSVFDLLNLLKNRKTSSSEQVFVFENIFDSFQKNRFFENKKVTMLDSYFENVRLFQKNQSTETTFRNKGNSNITFYFGNIDFNKNEPTSSFLKFSADSSNDGMLKLSELYNTDIKSHLLLLSINQDISKADWFGTIRKQLAHSLFYSGSQSVIINRNSAEEFSTSILYKRSLRYIAEGETRGEALLHARQFVFENINSHPSHWSGFTLWGDFR